MFTDDPRDKAKKDVEAGNDPSPPEDGIFSNRDDDQRERDDATYDKTYGNLQEKRAADALEKDD